MKRTKPGKVAGIDEVCPGLLRADIEDTASRLTRSSNVRSDDDIRNSIWHRDQHQEN